MCEIKIQNVAVHETDTEIGHQFTLSVNGKADYRAELQWYEKTTRTYQGGPETENQWEDLLQKTEVSDSKMFAGAMEKITTAKNEVEDEETETAKLTYEVTDEPKITKSLGGRTLEFVIIVRMNKTGYYMAACRQETKNTGLSKWEAVFSATDFVKKDDYMGPGIKQGDSLENIMREYNLPPLQRMAE